MYASKRRQRNFKRVREPTKPSQATNPSKRHRERLNGELETVAQLLPYDTATIGRLDKLSVLRLAVSFLQTKAHFQACLHNSSYVSVYPLPTHAYAFNPHPMSFTPVPTLCHPMTKQAMVDPAECDFETIAMKALGGFILIVNENGDIYYASENIEHFLGFHQSDVLHQPLFELIHSEDRDDIRQQLDMSFNMPPGSSNSQDLQNSDNICYLERNVNARFRCLLDNTCGFLRIDMRGKLLSLHGMPSSFVLGRNAGGPPLGLLAVCTPFVPPSTADTPSEDLILKSKHTLDGTLVSMDDKVHAILELSEADLPISFYQMVHAEDAICLAEAHKEVVKNGSSGLLIYRLISSQSKRVYHVQSSCRMFYKNGKPESIGLTHRLLNEVEGAMLLEKRSSLKAKLLSFDDSFLQSPRTLQSTAALPLPVKDDYTDEECSSGNFPSFASIRMQKRREDAPVVVPTALVPKVPLEHWGLLNTGMGDLPLGLGASSWSEPWAHDLYQPHRYPNAHLPVPYPTSMHVGIPQYPMPDISTVDYTWHQSVSGGSMGPVGLPEVLPLEDHLSLMKEPTHIHYPLHTTDCSKVSTMPMEYPTISAVLTTPSNGFHFISEVTNTLLG